MKDSVARKELAVISCEVDILSREIKNYKADYDHKPEGYISIKDCPKCEHPVMAQKYTEFFGGGFSSHSTYRCLTCGSEFTHSLESVSKLVERDDK